MSEVDALTLLTRGGRPITIRTGCPDDARLVLDFAQEVLDGSDWSVLQPHELPDVEGQRAWLESFLSRVGALILVVQTEGQVVGLLSFENGNRDRIAHEGHFGMSLLEAWRGQGVGRALLGRLLDWAESSEIIEKVRLEVFADNQRAYALYESMGFVEEGRFLRGQKMAEGVYVDSIAMYKFTGGSSAGTT
jgi:RimJ/RimL family protein N-acetyltransferase